MRLAPAPLFALVDVCGADRLARDQSRLTHGAPQAVEACAFLARLLREAVLGAAKATVLAPRAWDGHPTVQAVAGGSWRAKDRAAIRSSGYVIDTLEAALWAVGRTECSEDALVLTVNLGDDADTVGAVTGQLAGALYGASAIPERWTRPLAWRERIVGLAERLLRRARLEGLARFAPMFGLPYLKFAAWHRPPTDASGLRTLPHCDDSDVAQAFIKTAYDLGWVRSGWPWSEWMSTPEAEWLTASPKRIAGATADQLGKLVTALVRRDRFMEGELKAAFEAGLLTAIVSRADALLRGSTPESTV